MEIPIASSGSNPPPATPGDSASVGESPPTTNPNPTLPPAVTQPIATPQPLAAITQPPATVPAAPAPNQPAAPVIEPTPAANTASPKIDYSQLPSVEEMEEELQQSGKLLSELPVVTNQHQADTSPLASLQPGNMVSTASGPQPINIPSQHEQTTLKDEVLATTHKPTPFTMKWYHRLVKPAKTTVAIALTGKSIFGIYRSIYFILVEYPMLEQQLLTHQITQSEVNLIGVTALVTLFDTLIGLFFALRIVKRGHQLDTIIGVIIFLFGTYAHTYLADQIDALTIVDQTLVKSVHETTTWSQRLINAIPFLESSQPSSTPDVVWYQ